VLYVIVICMAPLLSLGAVLDFADMLLLSLAFPNILGMIVLSGKVKATSDDYIRRLRAGEMQMTR
jgi:AGCS family alanine or glycine:cation symporter